MAVSTDNAFSGPYLANGVTTVFPFTFTAPSADEVEVLVRDVHGNDIAPGAYSISINSGSGGSVTFSAAPATGLTIIPYLAPTFTQDLLFENGSAWLAEPVNEGYDRGALRDQVLRRDIGRALVVPLGESPPAVSLSNLAEGDILQYRDGRLQRLDRTPFAGKFYAGGADGSLIPASGVGGGDEALRGDLANPAAGALMIAAISPFSASISRTLADAVRESRSALEWFSPSERAAARAGDLSLDMTAAIEAAINSGAPLIDMHDYTYRVDGTVRLPIAGVKITGKGWSIQRGVTNNSGKLFYNTGITGTVEFENGEIIGNVVRGGPGYLNTAYAIHVDNSAELIATNMKVSGFVVGLRPSYVEKLTVNGGEYTGNILGGISGMANNVLIEGARVFANGFSSSSGQSHDIYLINGTGGVVRNNYIGDPVDSASDSMVLRYDKTGELPGFTELGDWQVYNNRIHVGGIRIGSDPGGSVAERKPPDKVRVFNNVFSGGAGLRFDEPQACRSWGNQGINRLTVGVASSYSGYVIGFTSTDDECNGIFISALSGKLSEAVNSVVFEYTTIHNGSSAGINDITSFGGFVACTLVEPRITGTGPVFSAAALPRYTTSRQIVVRAAGQMKPLAVENFTFEMPASPYTPDNSVVRAEQQFRVQLPNSALTINKPTVTAEGATIEFVFWAVGSSSSPVFSSDYKLTSGTSAALTPSAANQYLNIRFQVIRGVWRQVGGDASWTAA